MTSWSEEPDSSADDTFTGNNFSLEDNFQNTMLFNDTTAKNTTFSGDSDFFTLNGIGLAIFLFIFCAATVFGNVLVILAVARERYLHSVTNYFIASLAVADCLVGLVVMPFQAIFETMGKVWVFGEYWCDLWHSFDVLASTASIHTLCVISLDRYWAITDPFTYPSRMTPTRAGVLIGLVWVCSSLISFPAILWWRAVRDEPTSDNKCPFTNDLGYLVFSSTISFYGPLFVMVFTYYRIYKAAVQQTRSLKLGTKLCTDGDIELTLRIHRGGATSSNLPADPLSRTLSTNNHPQRYPPPQTRNSQSEDCDGDIGQISLLNQIPSDTSLNRNNSIRVVPKNFKNFSISRKLAKFAKEKKAAKTLGIVMGVFIICWLPFFVTNLLSGFCSTCLHKAELLTDIVTWLGWINSGMNPVIYACWSRDFRRAFARLICICCPGRIRRQYRPGGLRPRLARLTQSITMTMHAAMVVTPTTSPGPATTGNYSSITQELFAVSGGTRQ